MEWIISVEAQHYTGLIYNHEVLQSYCKYQIFYCPSKSRKFNGSDIYISVEAQRYTGLIYNDVQKAL